MNNNNIILDINKRNILNDLNFSLNEGEILGLLGPNGAGKTTIYNIITGLMKPDRGQVIINDQNVIDYPIYKRTKKFKIGYVPQYGGFFQDLTTIENFNAIAEIQIKDKLYRTNLINRLINKFELNNLRDIKSKFLSGGQKKKLVIALSLLGNPKILLLDECFAALDVLTIRMLQEILIKLQSEFNISICICDHQARDLLTCVDRALILSNGKILAEGSPNEIVNNPMAIKLYFGDKFSMR